ncbi:hypothetical protein [Paenibacillus sp. J2TS4]|uniref:hypothetical protein n=1 Tax=Paenibacillus sp. J2TS4 TaxID=2807194 RepID=UPI001B068ADC|nr:hypothetical protein [Paenibacillus sp. J2TS4]GIP31540.1 hypothetical protein J2TS4_07500 [Paenibacillus sp. J2TS4]
MKKFITGVLVGACLTLGTTALAATVKQYILTEPSYPLFVNGIEYRDSDNPILNYEGSTYIPLAKIGDLTGVDYHWNNELSRVEINTDGQGRIEGDNAASSGPSNASSPGNRELAEREAIENLNINNQVKYGPPKGLVEQGGMVFFYAYDADGNFKGQFTDEDDIVLVMSRLEKRSELPPTLSEGWISSGLLAKIYDSQVEFKNDVMVFKTNPFVLNEKEYFRFVLAPDWKTKEISKTSNDIRVKTFSYEQGITDEWVREETLEKYTNVEILGGVGPEVSPGIYKAVSYFYTKDEKGDRKLLYEITWPRRETKDDEEIQNVDGIRVKYSGSRVYYNTDDLKKLGILQSERGYSPYYNIEDLQKAGILQ